MLILIFQLHATRVTEGAESSLFKQYFAHWDVNDNAYIKTYASGIGENIYSHSYIHKALK